VKYGRKLNSNSIQLTNYNKSYLSFFKADKAQAKK
jgi:hypothetical protein